VTLKRTASRQPDYSIVVIDDLSAQKQAQSDAARARDVAQDKLAQQSVKLKEATEAAELQGLRAMETSEALRQAQSSLSDTRGALEDSQRTLRSTQETLGSTQEQLRSTQESLRSTQENQRPMQESLRSAQESLHSTQEALQSTQEALHSTQQALLDAQALQREAQAALQSANTKLAAESATDALTVLPNRRTFSRRSEQAAQALKHAKKPYGLILLDLDDLKQINDEYGHEVGDEVLRNLGNILNSQLRNSSDMAARLGGDEFAVLCFGDINEQTLHDVAERIHVQIGKEPLATPKGLLRFHGSFGLALSMTDDPDWKTLYGRADAALREAKAAGKDRISFGRSQSKSATARLRARSPP
jgi:diguanylate cyclase (GGDEF)-like protein